MRRSYDTHKLDDLDGVLCHICEQMIWVRTSEWQIQIFFNKENFHRSKNQPFVEGDDTNCCLALLAAT